MLQSFLLDLTLEEAFEKATQINEELDRTEFDCVFRKDSNFLSIDFRRQSVEKLIHQRKVGSPNNQDR